MFHNWHFFLAIPVLGYGFAWVGHFFFEKNKPATFQYPGYSLVSDFILFYDLLTGKQSFVVKK
ncbi:Mpo1-like protein [Pedobacter sp. 22163]|uniref:Mpo1-like protein n=1 Tax=Pedobacter sp. 22163 TaxID=3453883 RepID=UPI003F86F6B9